MPRHWAHGLQACLGDVVILSYYHGQLKIAELPVDAFRILQALEWEVQSGSIRKRRPVLRRLSGQQ